MTFNGIVFKIKSQSLILMTGDFEFKEIQKREPVRVGQKISFQEKDIIRPGRGRFLAMAASVLVIIFFAASFFQQVLVPDVYAYVGMDINPSIELALNQNLQVVKARGGNNDGREILKTLTLKGLDLEQAVGVVIKECVTSGYINDTTSDVLITTTLNSHRLKSDSVEEGLMERVLSSAQMELSKNTVTDMDVYVVNVGHEERKAALNEGVSSGHYFLWHKAQETGGNITLEQVSAQSVSQTMQEIDKARETVVKTTVGHPVDKKVPGSSSNNKGKTMEPIEKHGLNKGKSNCLYTSPNEEKKFPDKDSNRGQNSAPGQNKDKNSDTKVKGAGWQNNASKTPPGLEKKAKHGDQNKPGWEPGVPPGKIKQEK